jgi:deoxyribose-phosphate aldolase
MLWKTAHKRSPPFYSMSMPLIRGPSQIDMVVNPGKVLGEDWQYVTEEIKAINAVAVADGALLKVIFANDYLREHHIIKLCEICSDLNVAFVKTSAGLFPPH